MFGTKATPLNKTMNNNKTSFQYWFKVYIESNDNDTHEKVIDTLDPYNKEDNLYILNILKEEINDSNISKLASIADFIRIGGFCKSNNEILRLMLEISLNITKERLTPDSLLPSLIVKQLYDIVFHQIDFETKEESLRKLYFLLTIELLDERFHSFVNGKSYFDECIYFIMMADGWFETREKEFPIVWEKLQFHIDDYGRDHHLCEWWIEAHREFEKKKNINQKT